MPDRSVIILAGGKGLRMGSSVPKQFLPIAGVPMLMRTIRAFYSYCSLMQIVVVVPAENMSMWEDLCRKHNFEVKHQIVAGGNTRFQSVKNGLSFVAEENIVAIHDADRPFVSKSLIECCFCEAIQSSCGIVPVTDMHESVRVVSKGGQYAVDRTQLKIVQTPQVFNAGALKRAYAMVDYVPNFTDDASVAEAAGMKIRLIRGEEINYKITVPIDMAFANFWQEKNNNKKDNLWVG